MYRNISLEATISCSSSALKSSLWHLWYESALSSSALYGYRLRNVNFHLGTDSAWHHACSCLLSSYPFTEPPAYLQTDVYFLESFTLQMIVCDSVQDQDVTLTWFCFFVCRQWVQILGSTTWPFTCSWYGSLTWLSNTHKASLWDYTVCR